VRSRIEELFDEVPVNRTLGMCLVSRTREDGEVRGALVTLEPRAELMQGYGVVQGGIVSALADAAAAACFVAEPPDPTRAFTSIEFKLNFLRPALPGRGTLEARARVVQRGRRVGLAEVDVLQAGELVAKGLFTYLLESSPG
jgi:uncharacterized protein (TIGR00369 family)